MLLMIMISSEFTIAIEVATRLEITSTRYTTTLHIDIIDRDVFTAALSTEDVIVACLRCSCTRNILDCNVLNHDAVGWITCWAAIEIVLLNVDTVNGSILDTDVLKQDVGNQAGSVGIGLDACTILCVQYNRIGEGDICHVVVYEC
jgi:hypothetical protein